MLNRFSFILPYLYLFIRSNKPLRFVPLLLFLFLFPQSSFSSQATPFTGKVISVTDGDSFIVLTQQNKKVEVRLSGVDCPEGGQAYGNKAKQFTASLVYKKIVTIEPETIDKYGRTVAMVLINGKFVPTDNCQWLWLGLPKILYMGLL